MCGHNTSHKLFTTAESLASVISLKLRLQRCDRMSPQRYQTIYHRFHSSGLMLATTLTTLGLDKFRHLIQYHLSAAAGPHGAGLHRRLHSRLLLRFSCDKCAERACYSERPIIPRLQSCSATVFSSISFSRPFVELPVLATRNGVLSNKPSRETRHENAYVFTGNFGIFAFPHHRVHRLCHCVHFSRKDFDSSPRARLKLLVRSSVYFS